MGADVGAAVVIVCELEQAEQRRRLDQRLAKATHETWPMSDDELTRWAVAFDVPTPGELDGS